LNLQKSGNAKISGHLPTPEMTRDFENQLLREVDFDTKSVYLIVNCVKNCRHQSYTMHTKENVIRQRVFQVS